MRSERVGDEICESFAEDEVVSIGELDGEVLGEDVADTDEIEDEESDAHEVERFASEKGWSERGFEGGDDNGVIAE